MQRTEGSRTSVVVAWTATAVGVPLWFFVSLWIGMSDGWSLGAGLASILLADALVVAGPAVAAARSQSRGVPAAVAVGAALLISYTVANVVSQAP